MGYTVFTIQDNGYWYQDGYPYKLDTQSPSIGFKYLSGGHHDSWQYGIEYIHIGSVDTEALATPQDSNYDLVKHKCIDPCLPLAMYYTKSSMQGISFLVVKNFNNFSLTTGIMLGYSTNAVDVYGWSSELGQTQTDLHVKHDAELTYYPQIGVGYTFYEKVQLSLTLYPTRPSKADYRAIYRGQSPNISVGMLF